MVGQAFLGVDIGGQSIKGFRLEADGKVSLRSVRQTPAASGAGAVLAALGELLAELDAPGPVSAVGVGTPGAVDSAGRIAGEAVNIPGWKGVELAAEVARLARAPAFVRNDGNLAAYAEWAVRRGSSKALLFVGLGTGIGGGFIEDGRILGGVDDKAVEIGHLIVYPEGRLCACGRLGCVEAYASGPSIARLAVENARRFDSPLAEAAAGAAPRGAAAAPGAAPRGAAAAATLAAEAAVGAAIDARAVYAAFARGDPLALEVHRIASEALARAVGAALAFLAPDLVVIGGGVIAGAPALVADVAALAPRYVYDSASRGVLFERARLGPGAGLLGAALYGAAQVVGRAELFALAAAAEMECAAPA